MTREENHDIAGFVAAVVAIWGRKALWPDSAVPSMGGVGCHLIVHSGPENRLPERTHAIIVDDPWLSIIGEKVIPQRRRIQISMPHECFSNAGEIVDVDISAEVFAGDWRTALIFCARIFEENLRAVGLDDLADKIWGLIKEVVI